MNDTSKKDAVNGKSSLINSLAKSISYYKKVKRPQSAILISNSEANVNKSRESNQTPANINMFSNHVQNLIDKGNKLKSPKNQKLIKTNRSMFQTLNNE